MNKKKKKFFGDLGKDEVVSKEQIRFIKLMVEDYDFYYKFNPFLDQDWLNPPELRHIARTIKELRHAGQPVNYDSILFIIEKHYDITQENQWISWEICKAVLKEAKDMVDVSSWRRYFLNRLNTRLLEEPFSNDW